MTHEVVLCSHSPTSFSKLLTFLFSPLGFKPFPPYSPFYLTAQARCHLQLQAGQFISIPLLVLGFQHEPHLYQVIGDLWSLAISETSPNIF